MAPIKASPTQKLELARRKMKGRLEIIRGRVEADRDCGMTGDVERADMNLHHLRLSDCEKLMDSIQDRLDRRAAEKVAQTIANDIEDQSSLMAEKGLETLKGVKTDKGREGLTRDGWLWLVAKGRIRSDREATGNTLRGLYDQAMRDGLSSSANDNGMAANDDHDPIRQKVEALDKLRFIHAHMGEAVGHTGPADLLSAVCGRGETLRSMAGDKDAANVLEGQLRIALDMAGVALRLYRTTSRSVAA